MEFMSGYAAARAPLSAYRVQAPPPSSTSSSTASTSTAATGAGAAARASSSSSSSGQQRTSSDRRGPPPPVQHHNHHHPTRSNSTSGTHSHKRRRQHGHVRTNSASTTGSSAAPLVSSAAAGHPSSNSSSTASSSHHGHGHHKRDGHHHKLLTPSWLQPHHPPSDWHTDDSAATSSASAGPGPRATSSLDHSRPSRRDFLSPPGSSHNHHRSHHPERIPTSGRHPNAHSNHKQLPATPRIETNDSKYLTPPNTGSASEPSSARSPVFPQGHHRGDGTHSLAPTTSNIGLVGGAGASIAFAAHAASSILERGHRHTTPQSQGQQHASSAPGATMPLSSGTSSSKISGYDGSRAESVSSIAGTTISSRTFLSSDPLPNPDQLANNQARPFVVRNGRTYISDPTMAYPLPVDLEEIHRQTLRTLLLLQIFGKPICSPEFADQPPKRILEVGCGSAVWSMLCYKHYKKLGQADGMSFTGIDIAPLAPPSTSGSGENSDGRRSNRASSSSATLSAAGGGGATSPSGMHPDPSMNWKFVQHDCRKFPFPFADASFDLIMCKDISLMTTTLMQQSLIDEYIRLLAPGGAIEIWESDHTLRMLRPHVPEHLQNSSAPAAGEDASEGTDEAAAAAADENIKSPEEIEAAEAARLGAYVMTANTPLSSPLNHFLVEYNTWLSKALEARSLSSMPCTLIGPIMLQEAETLTAMGNKRLAVPLSEVRWEREGVGGVVTKDGKAFISTKPSFSNLVADGGNGGLGTGGTGGGMQLSPEAMALRRTALTTVVHMIQSLEHVLREVSGKSQDEWDAWVGKMMNDLVRENGTSWGECLEVGAWWARRR